MGFIKKIFGGIFAVFGSILKVFGIGKKGDFFMELDESNAPADTDAVTTASTETATAGKKTAGPTTDSGVVQATKSEVTEVKKGADKQTSVLPAEVKKMEKATFAEEAKPEMPAITNFATDYLVNPKVNRSPRRRPGPSVSPFKQMARDMGKKSPSMG